VTTDDDPVRYEYISKRLTREIVHQHEAARRRRSSTVGLRAGPVSLTSQSQVPDYDNEYDLARRATSAVVNNTGSLESPGFYITATMKMEVTKVSFHIGFEGTTHQEVAGFFADEVVVGIGRVFVVLMGSITNLIGWRAGDTLQTDRSPSDAAGMYDILDATLADTDAKVDKRHLRRDQKHRNGDRSLDAAHAVAYRHDDHLKDEGPFEFLAVSHHFEIGVTINHTRYDVALLGAPVWVATPPPQPFTG